jgi:hypothetical protein
MTTSGTTIYELSRDDIIKAAMRKCGVLAKGQTPDSEDYTNGTVALNALIAAWQSYGLTMWQRTEYEMTLSASTREYNIGVGQTINTIFPLKIESAVLYTTSSGARQQLEIMDKSEFNLMNSLDTGNPTCISYTPQINKGVISLWPMPSSDVASTKTLRILIRTPFEGFTASANTPDLPQEYQNALIYGLAYTISPEYGVPIMDRQALQRDYLYWLEMAVAATQGEDEAFKIQVDNFGR